LYFSCPGLVQYLLESGWLSRASLVRSRFEIVPVGRRNRNFRVVSEGRPGLFVKQVQRPEPSAWFTVSREAALYREVSGGGPLGPLRALVPRFIGFDPGRAALMTELIPDSRTLLSLLGTQDEPDSSCFDRIGRALATVHDCWAPLMEMPTLAHGITGRPPWILSLPLDPSTFLSGGGAEAVHFLALLGRYPRLIEVITGAGAAWSIDGLIHGDLRWDNILLVPRDASEAGVIFADWELFDLGDSAWDLAAILKDWLLIDLFRGMAYRGNGSAIGVLWTAYLHARPALAPHAGRFRAATAAYTAAQLCAAAFEHLAAGSATLAGTLALLDRADEVAHAPQAFLSLLPDVPLHVP
jgi:hypothetical protein